MTIDRGADVGADCGDREEFEYMRWIPLHVASYHGRPEIARMLLERGEDVCFQDDWGCSPLQYVLQHPFNDVARLSLDHGALSQTGSPRESSREESRK